MFAEIEIKQDKKPESPYGKYDEWEIKCAAEKFIDVERMKQDKEKMQYIMIEIERQKKAVNDASSAAEVLYGKKGEVKDENNSDKKSLL